MLKFFCSSLLVDIDARQVHTCLRPAKFRQIKKAEATYSFAIDVESAVNDFAKQWGEAFADRGKQPGSLEIILDDTLVKYFVLTPPVNAHSLKDYRAAALMRLETLFGVVSDDYLVSADWNMKEPSLVCALPKVLMEKINHASKKSAQHIVSMQPRFVWMWNQCKQRILHESWFITVAKQTMTLAAVQEGCLHIVKTILLPEAPDETWLYAQLKREAILHQMPLPGQILLAGEIPAIWKSNTVLQTSHYQVATKDLANSIAGGIS